MIYAMSDIHGSYEALKIALDFLIEEKKIDLEGKDKLLFLGDYIDRGPDSYEVLQTIFDLCNLYPNNVIALIGNHDEMFHAWLKNRTNTLHLLNDPFLTTTKSFTKDVLVHDHQGNIYDRNFNEITKNVIGTILQSNKELMNWYFELPYYYEYDDVLFVHAGFTELPNWHWSESDPSDFTWKYPATYGKTPWNKKIVAGHVQTKELHEEWVPEKKENTIYRSEDHIYIDGSAFETGHLNILSYDPINKLFTDAETNELI